MYVLILSPFSFLLTSKAAESVFLCWYVLAVPPHQYTGAERATVLCWAAQFSVGRV